MYIFKSSSPKYWSLGSLLLFQQLCPIWGFLCFFKKKHFALVNVCRKQFGRFLCITGLLRPGQWGERPNFSGWLPSLFPVCTRPARCLAFSAPGTGGRCSGRKSESGPQERITSWRLSCPVLASPCPLSDSSPVLHLP